MRDLPRLSPSVGTETGGDAVTARLLLRSGDGRLQALAIGDSARISLTGDLDPVIDDPSAAVVHAHIGVSETGRFIEPGDGGVGPLVNGERMTRRPLRHLDVVTVGAGRHLVFLETSRIPEPKPRPSPGASSPAAGEQRTTLGSSASLSLPPDLTPSGSFPAALTIFSRESAALPSSVRQESTGERTERGDFPAVAPPIAVISGSEGEAAPFPVFLGTIVGHVAPVVPVELGPLPPGATGPGKNDGVRPIIGVRLSGASGAYDAPLGVSVIGRGPDAAIRINSKEVSRVHATVSATPTEVILEDQKSANGTTVNGAATEGPRMLVEGDRVSFGTFEFRVTFLRTDGGE